jgi:hypothetical protein
MWQLQSSSKVFYLPALNLCWYSMSKPQLLGHKSVETTMIYTHVIKRGGLAVRSPLDE